MVPGPWKRLTVAFATTTALLVALAVWDWLGPAPQLPVTLTSIDIGDRSFRGSGEILVSPDGRRFALSGLQAPEPIYWRNADEGEFRPIPGTENALHASFSPDGESLVFSVFNSASVQRVALSGGAPQTLTELPVSLAGGLHWGDDGNIVFSHVGGLGLYRIPATGGDPEALLDPTTQVRNPRLLPGGTLSAKVGETRSMQRIRVGRRQRNGSCWNSEREWKRMEWPLHRGRVSEARQPLRTRRS